MLKTLNNENIYAYIQTHVPACSDIPYHLIWCQKGLGKMRLQKIEAKVYIK